MMKHLLSILLLPILAFGGVVRDLSPLNLPAAKEKQMTRLPYDAEVEWIKGDGVAYIDTGFTSSDFASDKYYRTAIDFSTYGCGNNVYIFGYVASAVDQWFMTNIYGPIYGVSNKIIAYLDGRPDTIQGRRFRYVINDTDTNQTTLNGESSSPSSFKVDEQTRGLNKHIYLFAGHYNGTAPYATSTAYFFGFSIQDKTTNEMLIDLIPVRKGNVGYMYDRVSKQLIGNANTSGAFSFGPDVRPAVDVAMGNMNDWKNPYVTDGLVAMWDAEWNAGGDIHDSSANTIKELVSGRDFTIGGDHTWGEKYLSSGSEIYDQYLELASVFANGNFTVEIVLKSTSVSQPNMRVYTISPLNIWNNNNYYLSTSGDISNVQITGWAASWWDRPFGSYSIAFGLDGFSGYKNNGSNKTGSNVFQYPSLLPTDTFYLISNGVYSGPYEFYTARIYNRVLTSSERTANYLVDKARFNIQ